MQGGAYVELIDTLNLWYFIVSLNWVHRMPSCFPFEFIQTECGRKSLRCLIALSHFPAC